MGFALTVEIQMVDMVCGGCGIHFAMPQTKYDECKKDSKNAWYCPNGHCRVFRESDAEMYRKKFEEQLRIATREAKRAAAAEKSLTNIRKRVKNGVCPCCHRTFKQLSRHMQSKHPTYKE